MSSNSFNISSNFPCKCFTDFSKFLQIFSIASKFYHISLSFSFNIFNFSGKLREIIRLHPDICILIWLNYVYKNEFKISQKFSHNFCKVTSQFLQKLFINTNVIKISFMLTLHQRFSKSPKNRYEILLNLFNLPEISTKILRNLD